MTTEMNAKRHPRMYRTTSNTKTAARTIAMGIAGLDAIQVKFQFYQYGDRFYE